MLLSFVLSTLFFSGFFDSVSAQNTTNPSAVQLSVDGSPPFTANETLTLTWSRTNDTASSTLFDIRSSCSTPDGAALVNESIRVIPPTAGEEDTLKKEADERRTIEFQIRYAGKCRVIALTTVANTSTEIGRSDTFEVFLQEARPPSQASNPEPAQSQSKKDLALPWELILAIILGGLFIITLVTLLIFIHIHIIRPRRSKKKLLKRNRENQTFFAMAPSTNLSHSLRTDQRHSPIVSITSLPFTPALTIPVTSNDKDRAVSEKSIIYNDDPTISRMTPLTDRQMYIHDQILRHKGLLITLKEGSTEFGEAVERIEILEGLLDSGWALERTDDVPEGLMLPS